MLPVFAANLIETLSACGSFFDREVLLNILASILALTINLICATLDARYYQRFTRRAESGFKLAIIQKLQVLSRRFYSDTPNGKILSKLVSDAQFVKLLLHEHLQTTLHLLIDIIFAIVVSLIKMPVMLAFYALVIPTSAMILRHYLTPIRESKMLMRRKTEASNAAFKEMLAMERLNRSQGTQKEEYRSLSAKVQEVQTAANSQDMQQLKLNNAAYGTSQGFRLLCLCTALFLAFRGKISVGEVVLFQSLFDALINSLQRFLDEMPQITQGLDSLSSIHELLSVKDTEKNGTVRLPLPLRGEIEYRNVVFGYTDDELPVLKDLSFHIPPNTSAAFIGKSGVGKSTILNLLLGLYSCQSGSILIDGADIDTLEKEHFRRSLAVVPQNPILCSGTLWDNLTNGCRYVTTEQVMDVLKSVGLEDLANKHPDGLMRPIFEGGENLSGGQRQRIAIARALLRNPRIILFDEATSALDSESEQEVQRAIEAMMGSCTVVVVAHRLNTLKKVDRIYRIEDGSVHLCEFDEQMLGI